MCRSVQSTIRNGLLIASLLAAAVAVHEATASAPVANLRRSQPAAGLLPPELEQADAAEPAAPETVGTPRADTRQAAPNTKTPQQTRFPLRAVADPPLADWGNVDHPRETPIFAPPVDYLLIEPAQGIVQPDEDFYGFEQTVTYPDETFHHGPIYCPPVVLERPDGLAPIGVIGDHTLESGQTLLSYRFNNTLSNGLLDGTDNVSTSSVLAQYPFAPKSLQAQRHTLLFEYAPTDDLTLLALLPFWNFGMNFASQAGPGVTDANTDPGDVIAQVLYVIWRGNRQQIHLNIGMQFPVGVEEWDRDPPTANSTKSSYPMRNSSGTYDFMPGVTYRGQSDWWTWGAQTTGTIRFGINNFDYKLGDRLNLTAWLARRLSDNLSLSFRLDGNIWGDIYGADPRLNPFLTPSNNPSKQGGGRLDALFGMNLFIPGDFFPAQWFSIEGGIPAYQSLVGPQLKTSWTLTAGYNMRF